MSKREELLALLEGGEPVSYDAIMKSIWLASSKGAKNLMRVYVSLLRKDGYNIIRENDTYRLEESVE